ncbi:MAG: hypothetical protein JNJ58_03525 [Chitinophagaceae bacterium]|nr:hypothetical protein [Chitinophagaceae bacterium]
MRYGILILILLILFGCDTDLISTKSSGTKHDKIALGRYLFYENRLSINHTKSCGSCHAPELMFADGYRRSVSPYGENLIHNSPSLINCVELQFLGWSNPNIKTLSQQIERPLYNEHPREMGLHKHIDEVMAYLMKDSLYNHLFKRCYPRDTFPYSANHIIECIVAFESTIHSQKSPYDLYIKGDSSAFNESAKRGLKLFSSATLKCIQCHTPPHFTMATLAKNPDSVYFNIGLYNVGGNHQYPKNDPGIMEYTGRESDNGKFRVPSLRNVLLTAPYMHDGSVNTIEEVIDLYAAGGRNVTWGSLQGDGRKNKNKSILVQGFTLTQEEKKNLIDFLAALTDSSILRNEALQNPFRIR